MPPAASPTMMVMGLLGKSSAAAGASDWHARAATTSPRRTILHIMLSPFGFSSWAQKDDGALVGHRHHIIPQFNRSRRLVSARGDRAQRYPSDPVDQVAGGLAPFGARKPPATASFSHM